jgi:hypothetical protein
VPWLSHVTLILTIRLQPVKSSTPGSLFKFKII